jgi:hypothetical protein
MTDQGNPSPSNDDASSSGARQRAIDAYEGARDRATDTLGQAPLLALAGGLAAGALIAALLPRTEAEARAIRPTARRLKGSAQAAARAARDTGSQRLDELGLSRDRAEETVRKLFEGVADAAKASANAALEAVRNPDDS